MLFPKQGGANDGRSVFVTLENTSSKAWNKGDTLLFPYDVGLKEEDQRYFAAGRLIVDECISAYGFGKAKIQSAVFWCD